MKEIRNYGEITPIEDRTVEGYALVFNSESKDLGGFTEVIEPSALNGVLERSDIFCLLNHSKDRGVLARSKNGSGSLSLQVDDKGLKYIIQAHDVKFFIYLPSDNFNSICLTLFKGWLY